MKLLNTLVLSLALFTSAVAVSAQSASHPLPKVFINADSNFAVALTAAINKKHVPVTVVEDKSNADYILQSAQVDAHQESAGSKFARCLLAYCAGIEGTSSVSVQLLKVNDDSVVWAYQVRKANGGPAGIQSLSEAIAKHMNNDYFKKQK